MGFGRANDIVTSYHNLSYSLNWSAVDRGTSRRPTANFYADFAATSAIVMKWWLRRGTEWLLWLRLYQNKRHCFKERCQYYLRMSCLFFYAWQTYNYKRLKLFFVIYMYYNNYIYLTHGLYIPCETSADPAGGGGGTGVPDPPPPWDLSKVGSCEEVWLVGEGVQRSCWPCYYQLFWLASLAIILQTVYILSNAICLVCNGHPFFYISLIQIMKWIQLTIPCLMIGHFHILLSKITRFNTI